MRNVASRTTLITAPPFEKSAMLCADLAAIIRHSRDLLCRSWALVLSAYPRMQHIRGGADGLEPRPQSPPDPVASPTNPARTCNAVILRFLEEHGGEMFCADCLADALFPTKYVYGAIVQLESLGVRRHEGRCSACRKRRLVSSRPL